MQFRSGIGAKLGAVFRSIQSETLRADALVPPLVHPDDDKAAIGQTRHDGPRERLDRGGADLDFRARQRVLVERSKLDLGRRSRGDAGRLLDPGDGEACAVFDDRRQLPPRGGSPRFRRNVDKKLAAALAAVHAEHLALDGGVVAILPHDNKLGAAKGGDGRLPLVSRRRRADQHLVHSFSPPLTAAERG
jgi:hypothetical protein